jgi:hypothetical protein
MAVDVWTMQEPDNGKLAAILAREIDELQLLHRIAEVGVVETKKPEGPLVTALVDAYVRCGSASVATELAAQFMATLGKDVRFLEARVAAVLALDDEKAALSLANELEPMRERLRRSTWTRLQYSAGLISGPDRDLMGRVEKFIAFLRRNVAISPSRFLNDGEELFQELEALGSGDLLIEPLKLMETRSANMLLRRLMKEKIW